MLRARSRRWAWWPGEATGEVATCDYCIPYERDLPILVGRGLVVPLDELWPALGHYD